MNAFSQDDSFPVDADAGGALDGAMLDRPNGAGSSAVSGDAGLVRPCRVLLVSAYPMTRTRLFAQLVDFCQGAFDLRTIASVADGEQMVAQGAFDVAVIDVGSGSWRVWSDGDRMSLRRPIVVIGDHPAQAQLAYDLGAVDFVQRDACPERFRQAFLRALRAYCSVAAGSDAAGGVSSGGQKRWIRTMRNGSLAISPLDRVLYFKAERKLTRVVFADSDGFLHQGINAIAQSLATDEFWRIHRGTIVNAKFLRSARRDEFGRLKVTMHERGDSLAVSRAYEQLLCAEGVF